MTTAEAPSPSGTVIRPATSEDIQSLAGLAAEAEREGLGIVARLRSDWDAGVNRFNTPGETLYIATVGGEIVGVCGLNADPYVVGARVGRVRRLYVSPANRRQGIGTRLVSQVLEDAGLYFEELGLRTVDPIAALFYEGLGFLPVNDPARTHVRSLAA